MHSQVGRVCSKAEVQLRRLEGIKVKEQELEALERMLTGM